jgi:hypothetical protein
MRRLFFGVVVRGRIGFWALLVLSLGVLAIGNLQAQAEKATLSGTAFDVSGAVVVGAAIEAKNINTGNAYSAVTDGQGRYILPEMAVGTYDVSAQQAGFQKMVQTGIMMTVGARRVLDFKLAVGQPVDVVEVTGQASTVDIETAAVSSLIAPAQMENLPLNGRNFTDLLSLSAGVATVPATGGGGGQSATTYGQSTNYSISGSRPVGTAYMLDNTDIRNQMDHGAGISVMGSSLGMEAIQEFTILTNTYSAEFGGTGAAVNAVTKSGTNDFHGTVYEYFRNSVLDAANYFDVPGQKPSFKRNNFGASVGGPIKKDKAFFFFNYEGLRSSTGLTNRAVVPTSLPELFTAGGMTQNQSGQWVGRPFGPEGPEIPINPVVEEIFSLYPLAQSSSQCPNVSGINLLQGTGLFCSSENAIGDIDYLLGRIDYNLGDRDTLFGRYVRESGYQVIPYVYTQVPGYPELDWERNQYFTISERHMFSPKIVNEARFGYVRLFTETANGGKTGTGTALQQVPGRQDMDFSPGHGLSSLGPTPSSPSRPVMNRYSIGDSVFMSLGAHSLRFGFSMTRMQLNTIWNQYSGGAWIFANLSGGIPGTPFGGALYGMPLLGVNAAGPEYSYTTPDGKNYPFNPSRYWRQTYISPYIQDDWKITKRLTLNFGLRYEWASNPTTVGEPVFVIDNIASPNTTPDDFYGAKHPFINNPNSMNFDPRIGIAWDPFGDHKTSVRAGFGLFHEPVTSRTYANNNTSFHPNTPLFFSFFTTGLFPLLPNDPNQIIESPIMGNKAAKNTIAWYYALPNTVDNAPYVMQYNLTIQRELAAGTVLTLGYNGSTGKNLFLWSNVNPPLAFSDQSSQWQQDNINNFPGATGQGSRGEITNPFVGLYTNPNFQAVEGVTPTARSSYNAMQISLNRQFAKDLVGNIAYTWSKCLDNASATNSSEQGQWAVYNAYDPDFDYGPCSFNSDHVFTANALYRLPFKGNWAVDGWQIGTIVTTYTGLPFNLQNQFGGQYQSATGGATEGERPNVVPGCDPMTKSRSQWYNPECFVYAPYGTLGNSSRNSLHNPNFFNIDFSIVKNTKLTEKLNMQFRTEFFNILNHPNFYFGSQAYLMGTAGIVKPTEPRYQYLSDPAAYRNPGGAICNGGQGPCYTTGTGLSMTMPQNQRQIQFAVKFIY